MIRKHIKCLAVSAILLLSIMYYFASDDNNYWLKDVPKSSTKTGRSYAYALFTGDENTLLSMSLDPAKEKISKLTAKSINILFSKKSDRERHDLLDKFPALYPILSEEIKPGNLELISWERLGSFAVMTFAYKDSNIPLSNKPVEIPGKGKMLVTIVARHYQPADQRLLPIMIRKMSNIFNNLYALESGTKGRWMVIDFKYNFSLNDYYEWVVKEGDTVAQQQAAKRYESHARLLRFIEQREEKYVKQSKPPVKEQEVFAESLIKSMSDYRQLALTNLNVLYSWGSIAGEHQYNRVEDTYRTFEISDFRTPFWGVFMNSNCDSFLPQAQ